MLTKAEQDLQTAAINGNYSTFKSLLVFIKRHQYNATIPPSKVEELFLRPMNTPPSPVSNLIVSMIQRDQTPGISKDELNSSSNIFLEILNELQEANLNVDNPRGYHVQAGVPPDNSSVSSYAIKNNLSELLQHPLVQQEMMVRQIQDTFLNGSIAEADKLYSTAAQTMQLSRARVFNRELFERLENHNPMGYMPNAARFKDEAYAYLLNNHDVASLPSYIPSHIGHPTLSTVKSQFLKVFKTPIFQVYESIFTAPSENSIKIMDSYFSRIAQPENKSQLASEILENCITHWIMNWRMNAVPLTPDVLKKQNAVITHLLSQGAKVKPLNMNDGAIGINPELDYLATLDNVSGKLFTYSNLTNYLISEDFSPLLPSLLRSIKDRYQMNHEPGYLHLFKALCKKAKCLFEIDDFMRLIVPQPTDTASPTYESDKRSADLSDKCLRLLMQENLVAYLDEIEAGSHQLPFMDPSTGQPFDLHAYLMGNNELKAGLMAHKHEEEVLQQYAMMKAILSPENRTGVQRYEVQKQVKPVLVQGKNPSTGEPETYHHSLLAIQQFMRDFPDMKNEIMTHLPAFGSENQEARLRSVQRLEDIATDRLRSNNNNDQSKSKDRTPKRF